MISGKKGTPVDLEGDVIREAEVRGVRDIVNARLH
jgi:hypothetical protein